MNTLPEEIIIVIVSYCDNDTIISLHEVLPNILCKNCNWMKLCSFKLKTFTYKLIKPEYYKIINSQIDWKIIYNYLNINYLNINQNFRFHLPDDLAFYHLISDGNDILNRYTEDVLKLFLYHKSQNKVINFKNTTDFTITNLLSYNKICKYYNLINFDVLSKREIELILSIFCVCYIHYPNSYITLDNILSIIHEIYNKSKGLTLSIYLLYCMFKSDPKIINEFTKLLESLEFPTSFHIKITNLLKLI